MQSIPSSTDIFSCGPLPLCMAVVFIYLSDRCTVFSKIIFYPFLYWYIGRSCTKMAQHHTTYSFSIHLLLYTVYIYTILFGGTIIPNKLFTTNYIYIFATGLLLTFVLEDLNLYSLIPRLAFHIMQYIFPMRNYILIRESLYQIQLGKYVSPL